MYEVKLSKRAKKFLEKSPKQVNDRIIPAIRNLSENPRPNNCKKLIGSTNLWRVRIGDYRILYSIEDELKIVAIEQIGHRREIY